MAVLRTGDTTLDYTEDGAGQTVVLVHGSASDGRTWRHMQRALARDFRAISYSRRFHYPNAPIPAGADYSMPQQVEDLRMLLEALDAVPAHLVGHSYGAFLCLLLAIASPGHVRTLVLAEPPVVPLLVGAPPRPARLLRLMLRKPAAGAALLRFLVTGIAPATRAAKRDDATEAIRCFGTAVLGADAFAQLDPQRMEQVRANYLHAELLGSGLAPLDGADLASVRAPALLIGGDESPPIFRMLLDEIEAFLPRSERATIPNASHLVHEDDPTTFERMVVDFLGRHST